MQHDFWHDKWKSNNIGFHQDQPHSLLIKYFSCLNLVKGATVFVPFAEKAMI
jgi:thiopurine S-methyltransferase